MCAASGIGLPNFLTDVAHFSPGTIRVVFDFTMQNLGTRIGPRRKTWSGIYSRRIVVTGRKLFRF
jgi:hypothetical protein